MRVLERPGLGREGYLREVCLVDGRWRDRVLFAILRREWLAQRPG